MENETQNRYDECINNLNIAIENNDEDVCIRCDEELYSILKNAEDETSSLLAWYQGSIFMQDLSYLSDENRNEMSEYEVEAKRYLDENNYVQAFEYYDKCINIIQTSNKEDIQEEENKYVGDQL